MPHFSKQNIVILYGESDHADSSSTLSETYEEKHYTRENRERREEKGKANDGLKENEFATVEFPAKKRKQFFIGRIDKLEADTCEITF